MASIFRRKSVGSPETPRTRQKATLIAPGIMASILRRQGTWCCTAMLAEARITKPRVVWLMRDDSGDEYDQNLERLLALPPHHDVQASSQL
jgi:hypothetical protein